MNRRRRKVIAAVAVAMIALVGCSSTKSGGAGSAATSAAAGSGSAGGAAKTVKVGLLVDVTGPAASGSKTSIEGVKAGAIYAAAHGYNVQYVVGDTATNPATALAAAQKMVTQDHVTAILSFSALTFAASNYLTARHVPVIGAGSDGPEWTTATNMFSIVGALHQTKVTTTAGAFFKSRGVTTVGTLGYSISPLSSEAAKATAASAKAAGIKVGYVNANFPFGSTNVAPIAIAMKNAGVNGFTATTDPNTAFALISALHQQGVDIKAAFLPDGYGGDLLQAGPGALKAAQNVYFGLGFEPVEMQTAATKQFTTDLKGAGVSGLPTLAEYWGYTAVGMLVRGLKEAGGSPAQASLMTGLSSIHDWDSLGLWGGRTLDINDRNTIVGGVGNCSWVAELEGDSFKLVPGADPICGSVVKGVTVSPSS